MHTDDTNGFKAKINLTESSLKPFTLCHSTTHEYGQKKLWC